MAENDIFNIDIKGAEPSQGCLLVAEPFLRERWFNHAVVYLFDYEGVAAGSMGVVLNHKMPISLWEIFPGPVPEDARKVDVKVWSGGPVGTDRLFFLHTLGPDIIPGAQRISGTGVEDDTSMWLGGDFEAVCDYIAKGYPLDGHIRFFVGYSGWSMHQVDDEVATKVWAVIPESLPAHLLLEGGGDSVWHNMVNLLGDAYKSWRLHPQDPSAN